MKSKLAEERRGNWLCKSRGAAMLRPISAKLQVTLDQFVAGEEIADLKRGGICRVRAMRDIGANAGAQIMANGARRRLLRIGSPHSVAPLCDGPLRLQDHRDNFTGTHEIGQLAKKRPLPVHGIKSAGFIFGQTHGSNRDNSKTGLVNARKNFALQAAANRVRLDNCKRTFESQNSFPPENNCVPANDFVTTRCRR